MTNWVPVAETDDHPDVAQLTAQLEAAISNADLVTEAARDAELMLARDDLGWNRVGEDGTGWNNEHRIREAKLADWAIRGNPLIKRGFGLRVAYIWGDGGPRVTIANSEDESAQDVDAVVQAFMGDPSNVRTFTGSQAREQMERRLGADGEDFLCLVTDPTKGRVQVRHIPPDEIVSILSDPEDVDSPRFYKRSFSSTTTDPETGKITVGAQTILYYPALGFRPAKHPDRFFDGEIRWDQPVRHVAVNLPLRGDRGVGDVVAALPWARASKEFLEAWTLLMKALSRFAWKTTTRGDKTRTVAQQQLRAAQQEQVGASAVMSPGTDIEAIPKTGATIDANSGRPLQVMVAAALGVPITMLLGDPGATGARAVAETLDQPTELEMGLRRTLWEQVHRDVVDHVIDQAVIAAGGSLRGTTVQVGDARQVTLRERDSRSIEFNWPEWDSTPVDILVKAIQAADQTETLPPLTVARLLLQALGVEHVDDVLDELTDDQGKWIGPDLTSGTQRAIARGEA